MSESRQLLDRVRLVRSEAVRLEKPEPRRPQDGYHFGLRHGFYDGLHGRSYENRANSRSEYVGYDEGYQRGKDKLVFMQGE
jgi:hypothetical protein